MPRFVILEHDSPRGIHWDLMLETGDTLATWALAKPPDAATTISTEQLPRHRLAYLDYEGPISGGRGTVTRWDSGAYYIEERTADRWVAALCGKRLAGVMTLRRCESEPKTWEFSLRPTESPGRAIEA